MYFAIMVPCFLLFTQEDHTTNAVETSAHVNAHQDYSEWVLAHQCFFFVVVDHRSVKVVWISDARRESANDFYFIVCFFLFVYGILDCTQYDCQRFLEEVALMRVDSVC